MAKKRSFFGGMLWGGIIGSAMGILFAPESGKKTRTILKSKIQNPKKTSNDLLKKLAEVANTRIDLWPKKNKANLTPAVKRKSNRKRSKK